MNTSTLLTVAKAVKAEFERTELPSKLSRIAERLNNPSLSTQQGNQKALSEEVESLKKVLNNSTFLKMGVIWEKYLIELGVFDFIGENLAQKISEIFTRSGIVYETARNCIMQLERQIKDSKTAIDKIIEAFPMLKLDYDELAPDEAEISIIMPKGIKE